MSMSEVRERIAAGWTFAEAAMGKNWREKYPNIANRNCDFMFAGSEGSYRISLTTSCGLSSSGSHRITYTLHETEVVSSPEDIYAVIDQVIKSWREEHDKEVAQKKEIWADTTVWKTRYPHLAQWVEKGKRCCVNIGINCVTQQSSAKVWHYDKPTNKETIVFERKQESETEQTMLESADEAIKNWFNEHNDFEYSI